MRVVHEEPVIWHESTVSVVIGQDFNLAGGSVAAEMRDVIALLRSLLLDIPQ